VIPHVGERSAHRTIHGVALRYRTPRDATHLLAALLLLRNWRAPCNWLTLQPHRETAYGVVARKGRKRERERESDGGTREIEKRRREREREEDREGKEERTGSEVTPWMSQLARIRNERESVRTVRRLAWLATVYCLPRTTRRFRVSNAH